MCRVSQGKLEDAIRNTHSGTTLEMSVHRTRTHAQTRANVHAHMRSHKVPPMQSLRKHACIQAWTCMDRLAMNVDIYIKMNRHDLAERESKLMQQMDDDATLTQLAAAWVSLAIGPPSLRPSPLSPVSHALASVRKSPLPTTPRALSRHRRRHVQCMGSQSPLCSYTCPKSSRRPVFSMVLCQASRRRCRRRLLRWSLGL